MVVVGLLKEIEGRGEQEEYTAILCCQLDKHQISYHYLKETDRQKSVSELKKIVEGSDLFFTKIINCGSKVNGEAMIIATIRQISS